MELYSENENYKLYHGNMLDILEKIEPNTIDSIVTDPPYELNFMSKGWDNAGVSFQKETWEKCYEVLKPGGYLLAFGGSRTFHRIACAIEDAGFEIRDTIMWLYGSGFPKSMNIGLAIDKKNGVESEIIGNGKSGVSSRAYQSEETTTAGSYEIKKATNKWQGWGTALKPSFEPIIVARKPFKGSCVDNIIENGVGGINIDECRVGEEIITQLQKDMTKYHGNKLGAGHHTQMTGVTTQTIGRFPANTILTYDEHDFDEVCGGFPYTKSNGGKSTMPDLRDVGKKSKEAIGIDKLSFGQVSNVERKESDYIAPCDSGSASRYFYCAKASKKDRDEGLDNFNQEKVNDGRQTPIDNAFQRGETLRKNTHPTVKPTDLMQYLIRLVTPRGGVILDPFNGSGSTGKAVMYENKERNKQYKYIGIELTEEYLPISKARIEYVCKDMKSIQEQYDFDDLD